MIRKPLMALLLILVGLVGPSAAADGLRALIFTGQNNHNWRETTPKLTSCAVLFRRGVEWAATGQVASGDALHALARYHYGQNREVLLEMAALAQAAPHETAPKLAALLESDATLDAKKFVCEQLGLIGTAAEVPVLARRLLEPELALAARAALERIPGEESLAALRAALPDATGPLRQGLIDALGARRDPQAVPLLADMLPDSADALAAIATRPALEALQAERSTSPDALLRCALELGDTAVLEQLSQPNRPQAIRVAAFLGRIDLQSEQADRLVLEALSGDDPALQAAAIGRLQSEAAVTAAAARFGDLPPSLQLPLLAALGDSGKAAALPAAMKGAASEDPMIRRAAIGALGKLGDASAVPALLGLLALAERDERQAILDALARLRGAEVDAALVASSQPEAIRALVARGAKTAVPALFALAEAGNSEAIAALGRLTEPKDGPRLIALLDTAANRQPVEAALVALTRRTGDRQAVAIAAAEASGPRKASLLAVLGALGGDEALAALRQALKDTDLEVQRAAVRALSNWETGEPLEDLQAVAETAADARLKALAARGAARLEALGFDVAGMPNLAAGGTASSPDGLASDGRGGPPAAAIDGDRDTYWDEVDDQKLYQLRIQMKQPATVRAVRIVGFSHQHYAPKDFDIACDDRLVVSVVDAAYTDNALTVVLPPTRCTAIQLNITAAHGPSPAIRELEIYGKAD